MKKFLVTVTLLVALVFTNQTQAQVSVGLSINIGSQPGWGPVGYDHVDYYYLPDIDMYYSVPTHEYIYLSGGRWYASTLLPAMYANFNFYNAYKVVLNDVYKPWLNAAVYRTKYASYKGRAGQQFIYGYSNPKYSNYYKGDNRHQPRPPQNIGRPKPPAKGPGRPGNGSFGKPGNPGHERPDNHPSGGRPGGGRR